MLGSGLFVDEKTGPARPYDRFRGRVTIPIADARGQFVGMGARGLHGEEPKYLNTPQSELFDKGGTLYGLDLASAAIREAGTVVVVEGYMDVMGPWQAGFRNVVATMGTSLTEHHAEGLRRFARRIVLAMDPDAAGLAAAERAGGLFIALDSPEAMARSARSADAFASSAEMELRVAPLPAGKDPDEITREEPETWAKAIAEAATYPEFLLRRLMGNAGPESPSAAREVVDRLKPVLNAVRDPVERALATSSAWRDISGSAKKRSSNAFAARVPGGRARRADSARPGPLSPSRCSWRCYCATRRCGPTSGTIRRASSTMPSTARCSSGGRWTIQCCLETATTRLRHTRPRSRHVGCHHSRGQRPRGPRERSCKRFFGSAFRNTRPRLRKNWPRRNGQ